MRIGLAKARQRAKLRRRNGHAARLPVAARYRGTEGSQNAAPQLQKCDEPKGTLAVVEPQGQTIANLQRYGLRSPTSVNRVLIQQASCFQVVERGAALQNMLQERALAAGGELQVGVKFLRAPKDGAPELMSLGRTDEVLLLGDETDGFVKVTSPRGDGWIKKIMLRKP